MLKSIQEISKATTVPETTIRRYIQVFNDIFPEGTRLGRTKKYPPEMADTVKTIFNSYQKGLSTVEIRGELLNADVAEFIEPTETTTLPPEETSSLRADIRELTDAVKEMTHALKLFQLDYLYHTGTTEPPETHGSTTDPLQDQSVTTEPPETQSPDLFKSDMYLSDTTTVPPDNHDSITMKPAAVEPIQTKESPDSTTSSPQAHSDATTEPAPEPVEEKPAPEPVADPAPETEDAVEEPVPAQADEATQEPGEGEIPDCHGKDLSTEERDAILIKVADLYPGRKNAKKRAEVLNEAGLACGKDNTPWTSKKFTDNLRHAKKRLNK
ncbi:MAG: hypothetical protein GY737_14545 [Desulfobacteraceae bacterium]|nr:hypothetical protein [Desulfobacteraceae bacterium]